jgi:hypothetical protein
VAQDQYAGRDAGAVEQLRPKPDDGFDDVVVEQALADFALRRRETERRGA